jgi:uncharacterized protein YhbP (UPF0306 family)
MGSANDYTFPFDTCEKPNKESWAAQPYSTAVNIISCAVVFYFLLKAKTRHAFLLILSVLVFDAIHTFSHFVHVAKGVQITMVHICAFTINLLFLNALYRYTKKSPSALVISILFAIFICDVYAFFNLPFLYYLFTQLLFFLVVISFYFSTIKKIMSPHFYLFISIIFIVYLLFVNEAYNCKKMLTFWPDFPYHMIIEFLVLGSNYLFVKSVALL